MNDISIISGVECYEENGIAYLKLETVARGLGFTQEKNGIEYVKWERVNSHLQDLGFSPQVGKEGFIPENIFYRLAMKAKNDTAEKFQALVADEIIPSIRKTGAYSSIKRESLSPTLQMFYALADHNASLELRQKQLEQRQDDQDAKVAYFGEKISNMKEIFLQPVGDWKEDINKRVREIAIKAYSGDYQKVFTEMYAQLEIEANTNLSRRCENKRIRMEKAGNTKDTIKKATTKLAIIYDDKKLRAIFELIVKKWAMSYCA